MIASSDERPPIQMRTDIFKLLVPMAAAVVALLLIAGCGGGDSTTALTKAQFIKQADAICEKTDKDAVAAMGQAAKEEKTAAGKSGEEQISAAVLLAGLGVVQQEAEELAELGVPSGDEAEIEAIVDGIEAAAAKAEKDPRHLEAAFAEVNKLAAKYGFKACSEPV